MPYVNKNKQIIMQTIPGGVTVMQSGLSGLAASPADVLDVTGTGFRAWSRVALGLTIAGSVIGAAIGGGSRVGAGVGAALGGVGGAALAVFGPYAVAVARE